MREKSVRSWVVGDVLLGVRLPIEPWGRGQNLHCIIVLILAVVRVCSEKSIPQRFAGPDGSHRVNILERKFLLPTRYIINSYLVGTPSFEGNRTLFRLRRIDGILKDGHAENIVGKVAEILNSDCVEVVGDSVTQSESPLVLSAPRGREERPAAKSRSIGGSKPVHQGVPK